MPRPKSSTLQRRTSPANIVRALHLFALWTACIITSQQTPAQQLNTYGHQEWSTENGLPQNSVHQIFQTRDGYIWIATEGGIARFDGINFTVFNHETDHAFTSDDICCLTQDTTGTLWIGTADGLLAYSSGKFHRYSTAEGLPSSTITALAALDDGSLLILTPSGLVRFNQQKFATVSTPSTPTVLSKAPDGIIWLASASSLYQFQQGQIIPIQTPTTLPQGEAIEGIIAQPNQPLWLRTRTSIIHQRDDTQRIWRTGTELPGTRIESFFIDSHGTLWVGTNKGLVPLDTSADHQQLLPALGTNSILSIFEDRESNLWIGTEIAGLHTLRQQKFRTIPDLSDHIINTLTQTSDGSIWIGSNGDGLFRWQNNNLQHFSTHNGLVSEIILALAPGADGSLWVGTPDGLNHIALSKIETYTSADGLPDDFIRSLLLDTDGSLWIGTRRGLAHWLDNQFTVLTTANGLQSNLIGALLKSRDNDLWIGTLDGLSRLHNSIITNYSTADGLSGNVITALLEGPGNELWIGTKGDGLGQWTPKGFVRFNRPDLPQVINSILEDSDGHLWLASNRGITRISAVELNSCGTTSTCSLHINDYSHSDGLPSDETSSTGHPAAWKTADGLLWFATRKGVAIADPAHLQQNEIPPPVVLQRFTVDDTNFPLSPDLAIGPGHNRFAFEYAGLSFTAPSRVRYRYILEGFDKQWTQAGSRRTASYTNLPPGHYRFRVQAANNDGIWNETGAQITFSVAPPFYRRLWFIALAIALIALAAYLLYRLRMRRLQSQFDAVLAERNRIAREIHDTLAQGFVGVSVQLELTSQLLSLSQVDAAHDQLDHTRTLVREGLAEARRSIWDLRATTTDDTLPVRIKRLTENPAASDLTIHVNIGGAYRPLTPAFEGEVLRIAQEALTNVIRHAQATIVFVDLRYQPTRLTLIITDNGRGFSNTRPPDGHFGLQGMRERAAQIHAQLTIESAPGQGTRITLFAPIPTKKGIKTP
jgi:signal transduction histidine kinase/ligand-binding sensor domain-containing protein